jgi:micrococcal nuclease
MNTKKEIKFIQIIVLALIALIYSGFKLIKMPDRTPAINSDPVFIERAVDGDTLKFSDGRKARLIGVDTPELHYSDKLLRDSRRMRRSIRDIQVMGRSAAAFTKQLCEGKAVRAEFDVCKSDKYGRLLVYLYLKDGTFINAKILKEGYGQVMTIPPNVKYADYFLRLQRDARENHRGLWAGADDL